MSFEYIRKTIILITILFVILFDYLSAQAVERWFWPLGTEEPGKIIMKPGNVINSVYGNAFFNDSYYIAGRSGQAVYSPVDGYVSYVSMFSLYYPDGHRSLSFKSMDFFNTLREQSTNSLLLEANLMKTLGLVSTIDNRPIYISGFASLGVKYGQIVQRGDYLGDMGYIRTFSDQPCIKVSSPDVGLYLVGEDNSTLFANRFKATVFDPKASLALSTMQSAVQVLTTAILEDHPALLDASIMANFKVAIQELTTTLYEGMPSVNFLYQLRLVVAKLRCSHSRVLDRGISQHMWEWPLDLIIHEGQAYVRWDRRGYNQIQVGQRILAINGHPISELLDKLVTTFSVDSTAQSVRFEKAVNGFDHIMPSLGLPALYEYQLLLNDGRQTSVTLPRMEPEVLAVSQLLPEWMTLEKASYELLDPANAIIRLSRIDQVANQALVKAWFRDLAEKNITNLIVDLRSNPGGDNNNAAFFFTYFAKQPFQYEAYSEIRHPGRYQSLRYSLNMLDSETESFPSDFFEYQTPTDDRYLKVGGDTYAPVIEFSFGGQVYVLVNSGTTSAAVWLARKLAEQGALTIGSETGGGFYACNAVKTNRMRLADTGLEFNMPLIRSVFSENMNSLNIPEGRWLIPRYQVTASLQDKLYGTDSILDFTLDLIANPLEPEPVFKVWSGTLFLLAGSGLFIVLALTGFIVLLKKRKTDPLNS